MAGEVRLKLAIEGGKVVGAELDGVTSRLGGMEKAAGATGNMLNGLQSKVLALSGTFATLLSVQKAVMAADAVTTLKNQLELATGSAQRAAQAYEELFDIAQRSRVSFIELGGTFASISRAGQELGISQERLLTVTQAIGQAMTISGGSAQGMQAALTQLGQGLASGTLRGEELNSVMEQAPRLAKALADGMGIPIGKLREMGAAGEITAQQVIAALEKSAPQLAREVEGATLTVSQAFTVLQNDVVKFVGDADKATGASAALAQSLVTLSGGVRSLGGFIREHETAFAVIGGTLAGAAVAAGIYATVTAIGALTGAVGVLSATLMANPILLALGGIAAGVGALTAAQKAYATSTQGMATEVSYLTRRIEEDERVLGKTQGGDALTEKMRARVAAMKAQRAELQGQLAVKESEGLDTRAEDARLAQRTQQIKAQTQAEADLTKLRLEMSGVPESYVKKMEEITRLNQAGLLVGKEYTDMLGQMQAKLVKKTGTLSDSAKGLNLYNDLTAQGNGLNADFAEKWALLTAAYKGGTLTLAQLTDAQAKLLGQQSFARDQVKALEEEKKKETQATADGAQAYAKYLESLDQATAALAKDVQGQTDHVARMGLSKQAIAELDAARLEEQATMLDGIAIKRLDRSLDMAEYNALKEQARLKRELARLAREGATKEAAQDLEKENQKAADKAASDWARAADRIQDSISDALMRGFENGKGFAENLRDTVVNMFKTMVLRPVVEMGVRGGLSVLGLGGAANAASAAEVLGNVGNAGSAMNGLSQLGGLSGWLTDFGTSAANGIIKAGELAYQAGFEKIGSSMMSLSEAGNFSTAAAGLKMVGDGLGYLNAAMAASEGKWGQAAGAAIGTALGGPIGSAIGGAIGGWVDNAFGGGHEYTTGSGISGKFSGSSFAGRNYQDWRNDGSSGFFGIGASGSSSGTNYSAMDSALQKSLGSAFATLKTQTAGFALALGLSATSIQAYSQDIKLALGADAAANQQAIATMMQGIANAAAATVLDAKYIRQGEAAADTLARLATNLTLVNGSFDTLDKLLLTTSQASGDTASQLVDALGGLQQYQSGMAAYYQAFYSEEERQAKTREQTRKALADLGFAMPTTVQGYRDLVTAQEVSTEAGRKTFAALINLSTAFASVTTEVDALQTAFAATAKGIKTVIDSIASARAGVASDRLGLGPQSVMGMDSIRAAVAAIAASAPAPSSAALDAANLAASSADTALTAAQTSAEAKAAILATATTAKASTIAYFESKRLELQALADKYSPAGTLINLNASSANLDDAYKYNAATNKLNAFDNIYWQGYTNTLKNGAFGSVSTTYNPDVAGMKADPAYKALNTVLGGGNAALAKAATDMAAAASAVTAAQTALTSATGNKAAADTAAKAAAVAYTQAVDAWTVEASKSVPQLSKLRDETLRYYEAQKALAEGMATSAANLRQAVASSRASQLDPLASAQLQQREFAKNYALALSTTGADKAAYADKLAAALPTLSEALKATSSTGDWMGTMARLFAQSNAIADQLDANAPKDYQAESLGLLDSIDGALAVLDDSTRAITRAIDASGGATVAGLRAVVSTLGGVPSFDVGTNYVPHDMFARIHEGEAIVPKVYNPFRPGAQGAGLGDTSRLEALIEQQAQQLEALRAEMRAVAIHTANTAASTNSMEKNGVQVWNDPAEPINTKVAA